MSALRRKKGNIFVAIVCFVLVLGFFALACLTNLMVIKVSTDSANLTLNSGSAMDMIFNIDMTLEGLKSPTFLKDNKDFAVDFGFLENIKLDNIEYVPLFLFAGPVVTSFLAIFLKRFRLFNLINFGTLAVSCFVLFFVTFNMSFNNLGLYFIIARFLLLGSLVLSIINLELCR